jgi:hypothetical protein
LISPLLHTGNGASGRWRRWRGFDNEKKKMSVLLSLRTSACPGDGYFPFLNGFIIISYNNNDKNVNREKNKEMSHFYRFYLNAFCDAALASRIVQSIIYNGGIHIHNIYICLCICVRLGRFYIIIAILIHTLIYVYVCVIIL